MTRSRYGDDRCQFAPSRYAFGIRVIDGEAQGLGRDPPRGLRRKEFVIRVKSVIQVFRLAACVVLSIGIAPTRDLVSTAAGLALARVISVARGSIDIRHDGAANSIEPEGFRL